MSETNGNKFWRSINSPFVVIIFASLLLPVSLGVSKYINSRWKTKSILDEIRVAAVEMQDKEKGAIKLLVSNLLGQVVEGVKGAFGDVKNSQNTKLNEFREIKKAIEISAIKHAHTSWSSKEKLIGKISNNSSVPINSIRLNVMFYDGNGTFIDVKNQWLSNIKVLEPKETVGFEVQRDLGNHKEDKNVLDERKSTDVKIQVANFEFVKESE